MEDIFLRMQISWRQSWNQLYPIQTKYLHSFTANDLLKSKIKKESIIHFSFNLENLGDDYPFSVSFSENLTTHLMKTKISLNTFLPKQVKKKIFLNKIARRRLKVSALLGSYRMTLQELLGLEKGDIILTAYQKGDPIFLSIADEVKFIGKFFAYRNQKAIHLLRAL